MSPQAIDGCAACCGFHGYVNKGRSHWFYCLNHRTRWCVGVNLFNTWQNETEAVQQEHWSLIADFSDITVWGHTRPREGAFIRSLLALARRHLPDWRKGEH